MVKNNGKKLVANVQDNIALCPACSPLPRMANKTFRGFGGDSENEEFIRNNGENKIFGNIIARGITVSGKYHSLVKGREKVRGKSKGLGRLLL